MADPRELQRLHTFLFVESDGALIPRFAIDGRTYASAEAVRQDIDEACDALDDLRIGYEWETTRIDPDAPPSWLPGWQAVKGDYVARR